MYLSFVIQILAILGGGTPAPPAPTYASAVADILYENCTVCHRSGGIGPFNLETFEDARRHAAMIKEVVSERRMPPWHADPEYGHFRNDRRLSSPEISAIVRWVDSDAPAGDLDQAPSPPQFISEWSIGEPDVIVSIPERVGIPATGLVPYYTVEIPSGLTDDTWVRAIEVLPDNPKVVHHVIVTLRAPDGLDNSHGDFVGLGRGIFASFAPGMTPTLFDAGFGQRIPKNTTFVVQIHYTTTGKPEYDQTRFGFIVCSEPPRHEVLSAVAINTEFEIPPHTADYKVSATRIVPQDALLYSLNAHMHYRGKSFRFVAQYPSGIEETLLLIPNYDFNWQTTYILEQPKRIPQGTRIEAIATYDNSANNPANPDPTVAARHGEQTWNEMLAGGMQVTWLDDANSNPPAITAVSTSDGGQAPP